MRVLAIDTVTEMCSVALSLDGEIRTRHQLAVNRHSSLILGMVDELLAEAGLELGQLDLLVNDVGPGSFTGIRIGLGVAQGLAYGADIPLLGVDALSTLAIAEEARGDDVLAMIDARMGQIYWAHLSHQNGTLELEGTLHLSDPDGLAVIDAPVYAVGSGWDAYTQQLGAQLDISGYAAQRFPMAEDGLSLGLRRPVEEWVSAGELSPVYLRNDVAKVGKKASLV